MRDLRRVCHLGTLDAEAPARHGRQAGGSFEGNGLSVSVTPDAWSRIARLGGTESYILEKDDPRFADGLSDEIQREALAWCEAEGLLERALVWRVPVTGEEGEVEGWMTFFSREEAEAELDDPDEDADQLAESEGWRFTETGAAYFAPGEKVPHSIAADYAVIHWAEARGFDGVWWEESYDPARLSAPRGVIFQGKLDSWKVRRGRLSDEDAFDG